MIFVGQSGAGKTSVKDTLMDVEFNPQHNSTDGIETHDSCKVSFFLNSDEAL